MMNIKNMCAGSIKTPIRIIGRTIKSLYGTGSCPECDEMISLDEHGQLMTDKTTSQVARKAVAKRGIVLSSAHNRRSSTGSRITEATRKLAQAKVRAAIQKS